MTKPTLDAAALAALAERMNATHDDTFGLAWRWEYPNGDVCSKCECTMRRPEAMLVSYSTFEALCLPCALAECERAESTTQHKGE